ncbi:hypothetical protein J1N35_008449, partial [Gossypium stocksii]
GDFNVTLLPEESYTFDGTQACTNDIRDSSKVVNGLRILDHAFFRLEYTQSNCKHDRYLLRKLDNVL